MARRTSRRFSTGSTRRCRGRARSRSGRRSSGSVSSSRARSWTPCSTRRSPSAGLHPATAQSSAVVRDLLPQLGHVGNEAARGFLDGTVSRQDAEAWLVRYGLMAPERAAQRVRFIEQYRSYVINYNLGQDLVREYIEKRGGTADRPRQRWEEFAKLISSPRLPSGLR